MRFIDTHSHIYDTGFQEDMDAIMSSAKASGIEKIYMPGIDSTCIDDMMGMETKYPGVCIPMMGLHPCYVKENYQEELAIVEGWLTKRKFAAIGEIGLDYYWDRLLLKNNNWFLKNKCNGVWIMVCLSIFIQEMRWERPLKWSSLLPKKD